MKNLLAILKYIKDDWVYRFPKTKEKYGRGFFASGSVVWLYILKTMVALLLFFVCCLLSIFYYLFYGLFLFLSLFFDRKRYDENEEFEDNEEYDEDSKEKYDEESSKQYVSGTHDYIPMRNDSFKFLWYHGSENDWKEALYSYDDILTGEQRVIENYISNVKSEEIEKLDILDFYYFLHDKYFVWKYTAKNRLVRNLKQFEQYMTNEDMSSLQIIKSELFAAPKSDIGRCLEITQRIHGLGTAGASGLLAVLFPEDFGTVDQFVVKRLQEIDHPFYCDDLNKINPDRIKQTDGVLMIEIMRRKAVELNKKFNTDFWTPRKIDMVLWAYGR